MSSSRRFALALLAVVGALGGAALDVGCSSDQTHWCDGPGCGDDGALDASTDVATFTDGMGDGNTTDSGSDTGSGDSGKDAGGDAGPRAHYVFVTSSVFTGDLLGAAAALNDGGASDAGDAGPAYVVAGDALCQSVAQRAGFTGKFVAILRSGADNTGYTRIQDSDGPWSLTNGTPVAESASQLVNGRWHANLDRTEDGGAAPGVVWSNGFPGLDCNAWSSSQSDAGGAAGSNNVISQDALGDSNIPCNSSEALYCAEVGPGAGPNRYPTIPAGGKLAFMTDHNVPGGFALDDAGVLDGGAPDAGDAVHSVADAFCNQVGHGLGKSGTFRAWVSSSTADAKSYFTSLSMNGPWFRPDGFEVAASLTELTTQGDRTQIALTANGTFSSNLQNWSMTGSTQLGTLSNNCSDYTLNSGANSRRGSSEYKGTNALGLVDIGCQFTGPLFCFEQ